MSGKVPSRVRITKTQSNTPKYAGKAVPKNALINCGFGRNRVICQYVKRRAEPKEQGAVVPLNAPAAIDDLGASSTTDNFTEPIGTEIIISLEWTAPDDGGSVITDYEYSLNSGANWITTGSTDPSYDILHLLVATSYSFLVRAVNSVSEAPDSNSISLQVISNAPGAPANLVATQNDGSPLANLDGTMALGAVYQYRLTWVAADDGGSPIIRYQYNATFPGGPWQNLSGLPPILPTVLSTGNVGTAYGDFAVRAQRATDEGGPSNTVSWTVTPA